MKVFLFFAILMPFVNCYDEKFDKIDVDKILADDKLFNTYIECLLDKGECSVEHSADIKGILPEIIQTACSKCGAVLRVHMRKSVNAIQNNKPDKFEEFRKKYDPSGIYEEKFTAFLLDDN